MATSQRRRVYWDASAWIALIQREVIADGNERVVEDRATMCKAVIRAAEAGDIEIATSVATLAEVCRHPSAENMLEEERLLGELFEVDYLFVVNLGLTLGQEARKLMLTRNFGLKPFDAIHLASAIFAGVGEMHAFDDDLLKLEGLITKHDGSKLRICEPRATAEPAPLLEARPRRRPLRMDEQEQPEERS